MHYIAYYKTKPGHNDKAGRARPGPAGLPRPGPQTIVQSPR